MDTGSVYKALSYADADEMLIKAQLVSRSPRFWTAKASRKPRRQLSSA